MVSRKLGLLGAWAVAFAAFAAERGLANGIAPEALDLGVQRSLHYFRNEQATDGSWTKLIEVSSPMYNCHMILLYEYLNRAETRRDTVAGLMKHVWSQQNEDGGFPGYPGAPSNPDVSALAYMAAKVSVGSGAETAGPRLDKLEQYVRANVKLSKLRLSLPYVVLFGLERIARFTLESTADWLLKLDSRLPWPRVMLYPLSYLAGTHQFHALTGAKFPSAFFKKAIVPLGGPKDSGEKIAARHPVFWRWMDSHLNKDGTLFDYTPTTVPALMALSTGGEKYREILERGLATLESYQNARETGIYQSPGEGSIGETDVILIAMLEMGYNASDKAVRDGMKFLLRMQQKETGAFGFSKANIHFPDTDDTANSIYVLKRVSEQLPANDAENLKKRLGFALDWLLMNQNDDGGFGTWEKDSIPLLARLARKSGVVLAESVAEHTARIAMMLALFRDEAPRYKKAYDKAIAFLLAKQRPDGSFAGTWFVNYLFGTSMALAALGTDTENPAVAAAAERALTFVLAHQNADGGYSESPDSFLREKVVPKEHSSPAQTGMIATELMTFLRKEGSKHRAQIEASLEKSIRFLLDSSGPDGRWNDPTWTGVTFPKVEYLIYPYVQEAAILQALGMYRAMHAADQEETHR